MFSTDAKFFIHCLKYQIQHIKIDINPKFYYILMVVKKIKNVICLDRSTVRD